MKTAFDRRGFKRLREKAEREWLETIQGSWPLICTGMSTCGISAEAADSKRAMERELEELGVRAKSLSVGCLGLCYAEPLVFVRAPGRPLVCYGKVTPDAAPSLIADIFSGDEPGEIQKERVLGSLDLPEAEALPRSDVPSIWEHPMIKPQIRIALKNCGIIDPEDLGHYIARGGYKALEKALAMPPEKVIEEVKISGLRGRGGAGFPTGLKWEFCRRSAGTEKFLICNADEGDPGAFMDRSILEGDPHAVIEGMLIAAHAIGSTQGFIYCRAEYPLALKRLHLALQQARDLGLLGEDIMGQGMDFDISIKEGAGAFVCGEETALMASIEGKRGMPRTRPPFPANAGLWGKPTNINNVETLANLSAIICRGGAWYSGFGIGKSRGTKTLSLAGAVRRTGLIEVPLGMTLREIVFGIGGGIPRDKACKSVLTGGPSGGCLPADFLDLPVDYESLTEKGSIMGSGSMIVVDEDTCIVDTARFFLGFTRSESCGKCTPCRIGTRQMLEALEKICQGRAGMEDLSRLERLANTVRNGSLCGLGAGAPNPVLTTLRYFREEYEAHVLQGRCPALVCRDLVSFSIDEQKCHGCGLCEDACPAGAISGEKKMAHTINQSACIRCGACLESCPEKFGAVTKGARQCA